MRVQVLLFVKSTNSRNERGSKLCPVSTGYALVNPLWRHNLPVSLLKETIPVVTPDQVNPAPNDRFEVVEVWEDSVPHSEDGPNQKPAALYLSWPNLEFVKALFPEDSKVVFRSQGTLNELNPETESQVSALLGDNLKSIEKLLTSGAKIHYRNHQGKPGATLAHFAAERPTVPLIALLHKCGADLNAVEGKGYTLLHIGTIKMNLQTMGALLENGANVDAQTCGFTALQIAVKPWYIQDKYKWKERGLPMVNLLIDKGAAVNMKNNEGWTTLHLAADGGNVTIVDVLLEHGASVESTVESEEVKDAMGITPLHAALKKQRWATAKILIEKGACLDALCNKGRNALYFAVNWSHLETVNDILNRNSKKNSGNIKAFYHAFRKSSSPDIVKRLMQSGFKVLMKDVKVPEVFLGAIHKNLFEVVEHMLKWGADVHLTRVFLENRTTPMHVACEYADEKLVQLLLDHGADPTVMIPKGKTPIECAIMAKNLDVVKLLLANKISVRGQTSFLESAAARGCLPLLEILLENGCQLKGTSGEGGVILSSASDLILTAVEKDNIDMVDIILKCGALFDFQDVFNEGEYCLKRTITPEFVEAFLAHGFFELKPEDKEKIRKLLGANDRYCHLLDFGSDKRRKCRKGLVKFVVKLDVAGKVGDEGAAGVVPGQYFADLDLDKLRSECEEELEMMKTRSVCNSAAGFTLFEVLMKNLNRVARYTKNEGVSQAFDDYSFREEYPHYGSIIDCRFRKGVWRREFLNKGVKAFNRLICRLPTLPHELKEDIVGFLTNFDIICLNMCF